MTLWQDAKECVNDPNFARIVPRVWLLKPLIHIPLVLAALAGIGIVVYLIWGETAVGPVLGFEVVILVVFLLTRDWGSRGSPWYVCSTIRQVYDRSDALVQYLTDYIKLNPKLSAQVSFGDQENLEQELEDVWSDVHELMADLERTTEELQQTRTELQKAKELLSGLETPSPFKIEQSLLDKLEPLESTRLQEAIQAYRVNAWTPAAAVCGMILEGRLQKLCQENNIRKGGIGPMIQSLGDVGLLRGYHEHLARVGEFFRHRASHPTSEEFDREKTTLVLTTLIILIRDIL